MKITLNMVICLVDGIERNNVCLCSRFYNISFRDEKESSRVEFEFWCGSKQTEQE